MMGIRRGACAAVPLLLFIASGAFAQDDGASAFHTAVCPVPAAVRGYPVAVRSAGADAPDPAFAAALAEAAARRWEVPSRRRASFPGLAQVRGRIVPPEPRWADDWFPGAEHVARLAVTLYRDAREPAVQVLRPSGDRTFDRSLASIFGRSPYDHPLPPLPAALAADSLRVLVSLGEEPADSAAGMMRFAAQQSPVRVTPGSLRVTRPRPSPGAASAAQPSAIVKYDVDAEGRIAAIQVLRSSTPGFAEAVADGLRAARFIPAQSNCRPIAQSVVQSFGN
jgi:hypothetical protein